MFGVAGTNQQVFMLTHAGHRNNGRDFNREDEFRGVFARAGAGRAIFRRGRSGAGAGGQRSRGEGSDREGVWRGRLFGKWDLE